MKSYIEERAVEVANFIINSNSTVRETAKKFGISKSTVHKDITDRVEKIDPELARSVRKILEINKAERHIRGGLATREKYLHMRQNSINVAYSDKIPECCDVRGFLHDLQLNRYSFQRN